MKMTIVGYLVTFTMMIASLILSFRFPTIFFYPLLLGAPFIAGLLNGLVSRDAMIKRVSVTVILAIASITLGFPLVYNRSDLDPIVLYAILLLIYITSGTIGCLVSPIFGKIINLLKE